MTEPVVRRRWRFAAPPLMGILVAALSATPALTQSAVVRGTVSDAASGAAVSDAMILLVANGDTLRTLSDAAGRFRAALAPRQAAASAVRLQVRRLGFAPADLPSVVANDSTPLQVRLTPLALRLDATVVTAARREQRLKDAVVPTELVNRAQIERTGASDVASVLTTQLGVQLEGGVPAGAGAQMQGLGTNRVLILVDGQPLVGRINGNLDLSRLPTANLERIEIVKGPQSTLYGSDAMGGVINLVTRRPERGHTDGSLQVTGGSRGRLDLSGALRRGGERLDVSLDVGSRSVQLAPGLPGDASTFAERLEVAPQAKLRVNDTWTLESGGMLVSEQQRYRTGQLFRFADREQVAARAGASWQRGAARGGILLYHTQFNHLARASTLDRPQSPNGDRDQQSLTELELTWSGPLAGAIVDAGLEARREGIVADRIDGLRRDFDAVEPFAQVTVGGSRFSVMPGARFTWNERWGSHATPRVAALWRPSTVISVRGTVGRGFRAPDFKELYLAFANPQAGYAVRGNLDLRPETSTSAQIQLEYAVDRLYLRTSVYQNQLQDFIETVEAETAGLFTYGNVAQARTRGVEAETGLTLGRARVEGGVAWLDARDTRTGLELLGRPRWSGRLTASAGRLLGARASATLLHTGTTPTRRADDGTVVATQREFTRLDLRVVRPVVRDLSLAIGVDNAFDRQLGVDWPGFTGRLWHAGMSWTPGAR